MKLKFNEIGVNEENNSLNIKIQRLPKFLRKYETFFPTKKQLNFLKCLVESLNVTLNFKKSVLNKLSNNTVSKLIDLLKNNSEKEIIIEEDKVSKICCKTYKKN